MAKFTVTLEDGRAFDVYASDDAAALAHAKHEEASRVSSERHRLLGAGQPSFSAPVRAVKVKD
jgi:hypothetical protein